MARPIIDVLAEEFGYEQFHDRFEKLCDMPPQQGLELARTRKQVAAYVAGGGRSLQEREAGLRYLADRMRAMDWILECATLDYERSRVLDLQGRVRERRDLLQELRGEASQQRGDPDRPAGHRRTGRSSPARTARTSSSLAYMDEALSLSRKYGLQEHTGRFHRFLGVHYLMQGRTGLAHHFLQLGLKSSLGRPDLVQNTYILLSLARFYERMGCLDLAAQALQMAKSCLPPDSLYNSGDFIERATLRVAAFEAYLEQVRPGRAGDTVVLPKHPGIVRRPRCPAPGGRAAGLGQPVPGLDRGPAGAGTLRAGRGRCWMRPSRC